MKKIKLKYKSDDIITDNPDYPDVITDDDVMMLDDWFIHQDD